MEVANRGEPRPVRAAGLRLSPLVYLQPGEDGFPELRQRDWGREVELISSRFGDVSEASIQNFMAAGSGN